MADVRLVSNGRPEVTALSELWSSAWGSTGPADWSEILNRSPSYVCAYHSDQLVGFVNVAWDGGIHASIFDTTVHPSFRRQGIATALLRRAIEEAALRGARWLHVDFEPHLTSLYWRCGFRPTEAGLIALEPS
jgi:ribosomal protein S18 acetylase RimI-like enzyme